MKTLLLIAMTTIVGSSASMGQGGILSSEPDNDRTGRLFEVIADFVVNYEKVETRRRAFVAKGAREIRRHTGVREFPLHYVLVYESKQKRFDASALTVLAMPVSRPDQPVRVSERWVQVITDGGKTYYRGAPHSTRGTRTYSDQKKIDEAEDRKVRRLSPILQSISHARSLESSTNKNLANALVSESWVLQSCEYTKEGDIKAHFLLKGPLLSEREIVFGKESFFMPISARINGQGPEKGDMHPISYGTTKWEKTKDGMIVPVRYEAIAFSPKGDFTYYLDFRWAFDANVPKGVVDVELSDWREPVRLLFDLDWQRLGAPIPMLSSED